MQRVGVGRADRFEDINRGMVPWKLFFVFKPSLSIRLSKVYPIMNRQFQFQSPFDHTANQQAKAKRKEVKEKTGDNRPAGNTEPIHRNHVIRNLRIGTSVTITIRASEEFPPVETLLMEVYDLTAEYVFVARAGHVITKIGSRSDVN